jgi:hypothetical protein
MFVTEKLETPVQAILRRCPHPVTRTSGQAPDHVIVGFFPLMPLFLHYLSSK